MRLLIHVHDLPMWSLPAAQVARIRQALPHVEVMDVRDADACHAAIGDADAALAPRMRPETLAVASRLRWVHTTAVGVGWLPLQALAARRIPVTNSRGLHADLLAEHAMAMMLALRRQLPLAAERRAARVWAQEEISAIHVPRLEATTVVVVGLGEIGARVAKFASAMGMRVIGVRRTLTAPPPGVERVIVLADLHEWLPHADVVVLALPHTAETGQVLGAQELASLKSSAVVINIARGTLIDEDALVEALHAARLGGAGLDVVTHEPLPASSPLWTTPRTVLTPHTGAFDGDYWTPAVDFFIENWARFERGEPLRNLVDLERGY